MKSNKITSIHVLSILCINLLLLTSVSQYLNAFNNQTNVLSQKENIITMAQATFESEPNGTVICDSIDIQELQQIISDGEGGAIITWADFRNGATNNVYAQRMNSTGGVLWTENGIKLSQNNDYQTEPQIISDENGGAIIVWQGSDSGDLRIFAQRINSSGALLWGTDGIAVSDPYNSDFNPKICPDGSGGVIIVWEQMVALNEYWIYAQKLDENGNKLWGSGNNLEICTATGNHDQVQIINNGSGSVFIVWREEQSSGMYDIYAQHVDPMGNMIWTSNGIPICNYDGWQRVPMICPDGVGGAIIAWVDYREGSSNLDIYAQRIDIIGNIYWQTNGTAICNATNSQSNFDLESDGSGGAFLAWQDARDSIYDDIFAQHIDSNANSLWKSNGTLICNSTNSQELPQIVNCGDGGAIFSWEDLRELTTEKDIYAQRLDSNGNPDWILNGTPICTANYYQQKVQMCSDGNAGAFITWTDYRNGTYSDIYSYHVKSKWIISPIIIDNDGGGDYTWLEATNEPWCIGSGTWGNPFILKNVKINAKSSGSALVIRDSTVFFKIEESEFYGSSGIPNGGLRLQNAGNGTICYNNCSFNSGYGISIRYDSDNNTIYNNTLFKNYDGILVFTNSDSNKIYNNTFERNRLGIYIGDSSKNNTVDNNDAISNSLGGIMLQTNAFNNTIRNNFLYNSTQVGAGAAGLHINTGCKDNKIYHNIMMNNSRGIYMYHNCSNNTFWDNVIAYNSEYGLSIIDYGSGNSENNTFYLNYFNNPLALLNAYANATGNYYDNGSIGNYWHDYAGVDENDDGIGDTPYVINGTQTEYDNFPIWNDEIKSNITPPGIPFGNYYILFMVISIISLIIIVKRKK